MGNACMSEESILNEKVRNRVTWEPQFPRPALLHDGGAVLLLSNDLFCTQPPEPYPEWLTARGITPAEWRKMVLSIDYEFNSGVMLYAPGMFASGPSRLDETLMLPGINAKLAEYVAKIAPKWAARGLRIEYLEGELADVRPVGREIRGRMDWKLLFSPTSSPAPPRPEPQTVKVLRRAMTGKEIWLRDVKFNRGGNNININPPRAHPAAPAPAATSTDVSSHALASAAPVSASASSYGRVQLVQPTRSDVQPAPISSALPVSGTYTFSVGGIGAGGAPDEALQAGAPASPRFCRSCGASLQAAEGLPLARFCSQCGTTVAL